VTGARLLAPNEIIWSGALSVERVPGGLQPWRLPLERVSSFAAALLPGARTAAGVALHLDLEASSLSGRLELTSLDTAVDAPSVDATWADVCMTARLSPEGHFGPIPLPAGRHKVTLWLPPYGECILSGLWVDDTATVYRPWPRASRGELVTYGSSITQSRRAASPARAWPVEVARAIDLDLLNLGFGGECHLDPVVARLIRDRPASAIVLELGINVHLSGSFAARTFAPAVAGFVTTVLDGHPATPVCVVSPIAHPSTEDVAGPTGLTLRELRNEIATTVSVLRGDGHENLHLIDGMTLFGIDDAELLADGLHPSAQGIALISRRLIPVIAELLPRFG
jgi:hypothetical protein